MKIQDRWVMMSNSGQGICSTQNHCPNAETVLRLLRKKKKKKKAGGMTVSCPDYQVHGPVGLN